MIKPKEIAILFKKIIYPNEEIEFIPIKVIEGMYDAKEQSFIDNEGTQYRHIIENPNSYGYCYRDSIENYKQSHKHLTMGLIKLLLLKTIKKYTYTYNIDEETHAPVLLFTNKKNTSETNILIDEEITNIYTEHFPEYYNKYLTPNEVEVAEDPQKQLDIKKIYEEIITNIIDQDEAIKLLLSTLWKQSQDIQLSNKNILLDGPSGIGKSKICKLLIEKLNIPSVTISSSNGQMKPAESLILDLAKMSLGDIAKAQKGIIIIDKFEDFIMYSSFEGRAELEKIIENNKLIISSNAGEFIFDTSNLIIIGITNLEKITPYRKQVTGFNRKEEKVNYQEQLEEYFTTIKLNPLNYESYIQILNSEEGLLNQNIKLLNSQGIKLIVPPNIKRKLALLADSSKYKVKTLESIIDRTLEIAEFEIASNPNIYSELIITEETINNNKAYTLKRKNNGNK